MQFASLLHGLMMQSSWGFGLYSSRRNLPAQAGLSDNKQRRRFSSFSTTKVTLYLVWGGGGVLKIIKTKRGAELILLLRTGGGHDIINFPFEAHFSVPLLIIIAYSLSLYLCCRSRMTDRNACLTTIFHPVPIILCSHNQRLRKKRH